MDKIGLPPVHPMQVEARINVAGSLMATDQYDDALPLFQEHSDRSQPWLKILKL